MAPSLSGKFHVTETGNSKNNWKFTLHAFINDTDTVVYTANINAGGAEKKLKVGDVIDFNDAGFFHGPDGKCSLTSFALTPVDPKDVYTMFKGKLMTSDTKKSDIFNLKVRLARYENDIHHPFDVVVQVNAAANKRWAAMRTKEKTFVKGNIFVFKCELKVGTALDKATGKEVSMPYFELIDLVLNLKDDTPDTSLITPTASPVKRAYIDLDDM